MCNTYLTPQSKCVQIYTKTLPMKSYRMDLYLSKNSGKLRELGNNQKKLLANVNLYKQDLIVTIVKL